MGARRDDTIMFPVNQNGGNSGLRPSTRESHPRLSKRIKVE